VNVDIVVADGESERPGIVRYDLSRLGATLCILLKIPPRDRVAPLASPHEVEDNFLQLVETENITRTNRRRRTAALKLNVAALHHWMVGDSHQIWRIPIHTTILDATEIPTNTDHDLKIASAAKFGYERRCVARVVKELVELIVARNRASMVGIKLILAIAKIDDHGVTI
jgi:hypothetical protein